ncbi:ATP12 family chaperone protein [Marinivivus vitaminiproducens]|uniref:ATP12 family chaperone protein n=1 Tax=Marinivivus vitaminiproducens TaxID=3035935 RepID=UPI00279B7944|nr:ATP12 family protein [Geminicoccaceae bacterium SCSIO 64248]
MKRFYKTVSVEEDMLGHAVALDGKPVRTPKGALLVLPRPELAEAIAEEWRGQGKELKPAAMRLTRYATTTVDLMPQRRADVIAEVAGFAGSDLLCYRAETPVDLVIRQQNAWQPLLDWAHERYDARLVPTGGVIFEGQPREAIARLTAAVEAVPDWPLVGLHAMTASLGSVVLGLALFEGRLDAEAAWKLSLLEELYTAERWGDDAEAADRRAGILDDLKAAERFAVFTRELTDILN